MFWLIVIGIIVFAAFINTSKPSSSKKKKEKVNNYGFGMLFKYYKKHIGFFIGYVVLLIFTAINNFFQAMYVANTISCIMDTGEYDAALMYAGLFLLLTVVNSLISILNFLNLKYFT